MRIALLLEDREYSGVDFGIPENGNPGVGGTAYCVMQLAHELVRKGETVFFLHYNTTNITEEGVQNIVLRDFSEICELEEQLLWDCIVITNYGKEDAYNAILQKCRRSVVMWVHNFISAYELDFFCSCTSIKQVVFVGKQLRDTYVDHPVYRKSRVIFNFVYPSGKENRENLPNIVTYTGSIIPAKGFHVLAKEWLKVLEKVPDAQLMVMGSGKLYNHSEKMGRYQIASEDYEKLFMPFLTDARGEILSSVHFLGIVKQEKNDIYRRTKVGIVNPTACTEICSISALEMQVMGIPVISRAKYGMLDVVKDGTSGRLIHRERSLHKEIIRLLQNEDINRNLSRGAVRFVRENFSPERSLGEWFGLFHEIKENKVRVIQNSKIDFPFNQYKWLRLLNAKLQKIPGLHGLPSVAKTREKISEVYQRIKGSR